MKGTIGAVGSGVEMKGTVWDRASEIRTSALLPSVSSSRYEDAWSKFMAWKGGLQDVNADPDESMLLVYLDHLSTCFAPSSLWTTYSMLKRQMLVRKFINPLDKLQA